MVASEEGVMGGVRERGLGGVCGGGGGFSRLRRENRWSAVSDWIFRAYRFWVRVLRTRTRGGEIRLAYVFWGWSICG